MNSLNLSLFGYNCTDYNVRLSNSFILNSLTIILIICMFTIARKWNKDKAWSNKFFYIFRVSVLSKYMFWASTYLCFWWFFEILDLSEFKDARIISYISSTILLWALSVFIYCFVIYSTEKWFFWNRYASINSMRKEFMLLDSLKPLDYRLLIRYNFVKKAMFSLTVVAQIKLNLSVYAFTFLMISTQSLYSNLIFGLWQFNSVITRGLFILN